MDCRAELIYGKSFSGLCPWFSKYLQTCCSTKYWLTNGEKLLQSNSSMAWYMFRSTSIRVWPDINTGIGSLRHYCQYICCYDPKGRENALWAANLTFPGHHMAKATLSPSTLRLLNQTWQKTCTKSYSYSLWPFSELLKVIRPPLVVESF